MDANKLLDQIAEFFKDGKLLTVRDVMELVNRGIPVTDVDYIAMPTIKWAVLRLEQLHKLTRRTEQGKVLFRVTVVKTGYDLKSATNEEN